MFVLLLLPISIALHLLLLLIKPFLWILRKTGLYTVLLYVIFLVILDNRQIVSPNDPVHDYFDLGLTTAHDYAYLGLFLLLLISMIITVYRIWRLLRLLIV